MGYIDLSKFFTNIYEKPKDGEQRLTIDGKEVQDYQPLVNGTIDKSFLDEDSFWGKKYKAINDKYSGKLTEEQLAEKRKELLTLYKKKNAAFTIGYGFSKLNVDKISKGIQESISERAKRTLDFQNAMQQRQNSNYEKLNGRSEYGLDKSASLQAQTVPETKLPYQPGVSVGYGKEGMKIKEFDEQLGKFYRNMLEGPQYAGIESRRKNVKDAKLIASRLLPMSRKLNTNDELLRMFKQYASTSGFDLNYLNLFR